MPNASFLVWVDQNEAHPNSFAFFRFRFDLRRETATEAHLSVFADTRYRLTVNGAAVGYGPAAFHLSHPECDGYDLLPYLKEGTNEIIVLVNHRGLNSYQAVPSRAAFWAKGFVKHRDGTIDLGTPGEWETKLSNAWWSNAPTFSFAQACTEILDFKEHEKELSDEAGWSSPVIIPQDNWGPLAPRSVPPLSLREQLPLKLVACGPASSTEYQRSFHQHFLEMQKTAHTPKADSLRFPYATWIFSPIEQSLTLGLFWGPHYLNGQELEPTRDRNFGNRENYAVNLKAGWNLLYGEPEILGISWGLQIAWPVSANLKLSPSKEDSHGNTTEDNWCLVGKAMPSIELAAKRGSNPGTADCLSRLGDLLQPLAKVTHSPFPTRHCSWQTLENQATTTFPAEFPLSVPLNTAGEGIVVLDFNTEWIGHASIEIEAPEGAILRVTNDELLRPDGLIRFYLSSHLVNNTDMYVLDGKRRLVEGFHQRGGRYVQLNISSPNGPVILHRAAVRRHLLDLPVEGSFSCSDPLLNWVWHAGVATQQASLHEAWVDPWREQGSYLGDTFVETLATRCYSPELSPMRRCLLNWLYGQHENGQMPCVTPSWYTGQHEDFTLIWVLMARNYAMLSKDEETTRKLMGGVRKILNGPSWKTDSSGLWTAKGTRTFCDWGCTNEAIQCDANAILNAFRVGALDAAAEMTSWLGDRTEANAFREEANRIRSLYAKTLWIEAEGCYAGGIADGKKLAAYGHGNCVALLFNIGSTQQLERLKAWLETFLLNQIKTEQSLTQRCGHVDLYFLNYAIEALAQHGANQTVVKVIRGIWGNHQKYDALTLWESYVRGLNGVGSQCHGWAAAPMIYYMRHVLGIDIEMTSENIIVLRPNCPELSWAQGEFPLHSGSLRIGYQKYPTEVVFTISAPKNYEVKLELGSAWGPMKSRVAISYI